MSLSDRSEIAPRLFVGSKPSLGRLEGVDVLVLAAEEYQPDAAKFPGVEVMHMPIDDSALGMSAHEVVAVLQTAARVARRLRAGRAVLVTCQMGLNRSALVAAIALHEIYGMTADEIIRRLRVARGAYSMSNPHFERMLRFVIAAKRQRETSMSSHASVSALRSE